VRNRPDEALAVAATAIDRLAAMDAPVTLIPVVPVVTRAAVAVR
jgi:hypothetical protein